MRYTADKRSLRASGVAGGSQNDRDIYGETQGFYVLHGIHTRKIRIGGYGLREQSDWKHDYSGAEEDRGGRVRYVMDTALGSRQRHSFNGIRNIKDQILPIRSQGNYGNEQVKVS